MTTPRIEAAEVRRRIVGGREILLADVRNEATHAEGHPLWAANLPLHRIEVELIDRVPHRSVPIVVLAGDDGAAEVAVARARRLGYTSLEVLDGGIEGWTASRGVLFADVNSASKAFGELVAERAQTPFIDPLHLDADLRSGSKVLVVDPRTGDEHRRMSVPTAISVPGAELVARVTPLAADPLVPVVVSCAGRTRSIIGTQSLRNAGIPNPVFSLRNGTIGWTLAGLELDVGSDATYDAVRHLPDPTLAANARHLAASCGVSQLDRRAVERIVAHRNDSTRTTYLLDVRSNDDHELGHPRGFRPAPGGQLIQETDVHLPVRGAQVVLFDDLAVRADMTASWLAQMGWEVAVAPVDLPLVVEPAIAPDPSDDLPRTSVDALRAALSDGHRSRPLLVDLSPSAAYRQRHLPTAVWGLRDDPALARLLAAHLAVVVTADDPRLAVHAVREWSQQLATTISVLDGGNPAWAAAGLTSTDADPRWISDPDEAYRRPYVGTDVTPEAMAAYIEWEHGLVAQLAADGTHGFWVHVAE